MRLSPARPASVLCLAIVWALVTGRAATGPENNDATSVTRVTVRGNTVREYDWAKLQARARIAYVSSGPRTLSNRMIDNDLQTAFQFSESDKSPTVIVELARNAKLHRISTAFKAEDAKLDAYFLNELPKDTADLRFTKPDVTVVDLPDQHGMITVDFAVSSARYVVLRWTRSKWDEPFAVAEISAFSNDPADLISDQDVLLAENAKGFAVAESPPIPVPVPIPISP